MHPDIHLEQAQQASKEILTAMQRLMAQLTAAPTRQERTGRNALLRRNIPFPCSPDR